MRKVNYLDPLPDRQIVGAVVADVDPIDGLNLEQRVTDVTADGEPVFGVAVVNDISLLFNQQRLQALGPDSVNAFLQRINNNFAMSSKTPQMTDEQLFMFIKDKHIQSASELLAWSQYLNDNYQSVIDEYNKAVDDKAAADKAVADKAAADNV